MLLSEKIMAFPGRETGRAAAAFPSPDVYAYGMLKAPSFQIRSG